MYKNRISTPNINNKISKIAQYAHYILTYLCTYAIFTYFYNITLCKVAQRTCQSAIILLFYILIASEM